MPRLIYVHDPLCGWCYGFIPTIEHFAETHPQIDIELLPGGLVKGDRVGPYAAMRDYITKAAPRMTAITGQALGAAFFDMMRQAETPLSISAPPSHAILQMKALVRPHQVLDFAHALQTAHFADGEDLNAPETYDRVCAELGLPKLDKGAIATATEDTPLVANSYARAQELGVTSFPTVLVMEADRCLGKIDGVYDPAEFSRRYGALVSLVA